MIAEVPYALLTTALVLVGLWYANLLYDKGIPNYQSRKAGHAIGGIAYFFFAFLFSEVWWPLIISGGFVLLLGGARLIRPATFRGVGGTGRRREEFSEIYFPAAGTLVLGIGWGVFNEPLITVACINMMALGDCATGLVRGQLYRREVKGLWGSVACFIVCLVLAWCFIEPLWVGLLAAVAATLAEYTCGRVGLIKWADDNWAIPISAALVTFGALYVIGQL